MRSFAVAAVIALTACGRVGFQLDGDKDGGNIGDGLAADGDGSSAQACSAVFDLCDGFEATSIDPLWTVDPGATRTTTRAHRGAASLAMHLPMLAAGQRGAAAVLEKVTLQSAATTFWVRAWFWLAALPAGNNGLELISAESPSNGNYTFVHAIDIQVYNTSSMNYVSQMSPPPTGAWFCMVWKVVRSTTATGSLELTLEPMTPIVLSNVITDSVPTLATLRIGLNFASGNVNVTQPAFDAWLDDVIVHSAPVTCAD